MIEVKITAPLELATVCAMIGKAFDPDVGGEYSFYPVYPAGHSNENPLPATHIETQFYAVPSYAAGFPYLMADPELLRLSCELDYQARWPELVPPTLAECEQFAIVATLDVAI